MLPILKYSYMMIIHGDRFLKSQGQVMR